VLEIPYADSKEGTTTGEVAEILEEKYSVMGIFYEAHSQEIADDLTESLKGSLETMLMGQSVDPADIFNGGADKIEKRFHSFLEDREIEYLSGLAGGTRGISPIPTKAALEGRSKRFKKGRGARRPSFIDTSLYEQSMKAWVDKI